MPQNNCQHWTHISEQPVARGQQLLSLIEVCPHLLWPPSTVQLSCIILHSAHSNHYISCQVWSRCETATPDLRQSSTTSGIQILWDFVKQTMLVFITFSPRKQDPGSLEKPSGKSTPDSAHLTSFLRVSFFLGCVFHFFFGHFCFFPALRSVSQLTGGQFFRLDDKIFLSVPLLSQFGVWGLCLSH